MTKLELDKYEEDILAAYEADEFISIMTPERRKEVQQIAENALKEEKRIDIRISNRDLVAIQKRALEEGIPYQTLISSILHKYASGNWRDFIANKAD
ncbi:MAG: hypothetical protein LGR52_05580 [Candidatus Thiosymbion ectosymbiont of Robbea hypermnestra]|nr:hypothetical protein [Candidatus Thiosymbion ectosymbiont of Robbea hypermnestra]